MAEMALLLGKLSTFILISHGEDKMLEDVARFYVLGERLGL
jgi:hypothetical protein